ncbi:MAG: hypothetical protein LBC29_05150, partial [Propionibacteriaceae bacterium]|nr:hypothetical protein [Propionibacteriaceae bacterium]
NEFAIAAGLEGADLSAFQTCYDNRRSEDFVKAVATNALADAVSATPAYLVNGEPLGFTTLELTNGRVSEESLRTAIKAIITPEGTDAALNAVKRTGAADE